MLIDLNDIDLVKGMTKTEAKAVHKDLPPGGEWRTIKGHHIYIKDGKILAGSIPGVTKAKKMTKQQMSEHQATMDKGATKGTKKDAKSAGKGTAKASKPAGKKSGNDTKGKNASKAGKGASKPAVKKGGGVDAKAAKKVQPKPQKANAGVLGGDKPKSAGKSAASAKPGAEKSGAKTKKVAAKGKANGTKKVEAKSDGKSTKPATKSSGTGKPVQPTGKSKPASEGGVKSQPTAEEVKQEHALWSLVNQVNKPAELYGEAKKNADVLHLFRTAMDKAEGTTPMSKMKTLFDKYKGKPEPEKPASEESKFTNAPTLESIAKKAGNPVEFGQEVMKYTHLAEELVKHAQAQTHKPGADVLKELFESLSGKKAPSKEEEMEAKAKEVAQSTHSAMSWHIQLNQHHKDVLDYVYKQKEKLGLTDKELHQRYSHADLNIAPSEPTPDDHYEVYHGTKMYAAESIKEEGFHMNGSEEDFGHAVYFKSPEYDQHDINDYNKWVQDREAQGFDMKHANAKSHGYDTHKIVNGFAGKSNESAVIKAFIPKKHVLDCTKGRPAELDELVNSFKNSYGTQKKVRALLKHWLGMDTEGMSDKEAAEAYSANKPKLEEKRGTKVILGSISPYEVYARKHGIGAIVDVLGSYKDEGVQIGVYDPKLIQIKDVGKKLQRADHQVGKVHLLKALMKAKAAGYCLLHHHIDEDGLHLYVGALGSSEVNKSLGYTKRSAYNVANPEDVIYIPTNRLRTVYQTEKATNWDKVKENAVRMLAGEHLEPVSIGFDYDVHDGHHRIEASKQLGHEHIPCVVKGGNELERQSAIEAYREVWKSFAGASRDAMFGYFKDKLEDGESVDGAYEETINAFDRDYGEEMDFRAYLKQHGYKVQDHFWVNKSLGKEAFEDDERFIYRGVGLRELHFIQKHGYIQSKGKGNNADQTNQFTCFSTRYGQAEGYARTNYDLYNERQAFVIALPKPHYMHGLDGEVAIRGQISTEGMKVIPIPKSA